MSALLAPVCGRKAAEKPLFSLDPTRRSGNFQASTKGPLSRGRQWANSGTLRFWPRGLPPCSWRRRRCLPPIVRPACSPSAPRARFRLMNCPRPACPAARCSLVAASLSGNNPSLRAAGCLAVVPPAPCWRPTWRWISARAGHRLALHRWQPRPRPSCRRSPRLISLWPMAAVIPASPLRRRTICSIRLGASFSDERLDRFQFDAGAPTGPLALTYDASQSRSLLGGLSFDVSSALGPGCHRHRVAAHPAFLWASRAMPASRPRSSTAALGVSAHMDFGQGWVTTASFSEGLTATRSARRIRRRHLARTILFRRHRQARRVRRRCAGPVLLAARAQHGRQLLGAVGVRRRAADGCPGAFP